MTKYITSWTQQAYVSSGKRQLQHVLAYDVVVWEKLHGLYNSGLTYLVRPRNKVL